MRRGDVLDKLTGHTDPLIPPRRKNFAGGQFREIGDEFFVCFRDYGQIAPHHRILDIGSGIGRMARPLTAFLDPATGRYEGFDIDVGGVVWCLQHYHPNLCTRPTSAPNADGLFGMVTDNGNPAQHRYQQLFGVDTVDAGPQNVRRPRAARMNVFRSFLFGHWEP